jgi:hypothetical protein
VEYDDGDVEWYLRGVVTDQDTVLDPEKRLAFLKNLIDPS